MVVEAKVASSYKVVQEIEPITTSGPVLAGKFAGETDVIATRDQEKIVLRDRKSGTAKKSFTIVEDEEQSISAYAISPTHLFTVLSNSLLESRDLTSGEISRSWRAHTSPVLCMDHHPKAALLATGSADHSVRIWNSTQGFCTHNLKGVHGGVVNVVLFHPDASKMEVFSAAEDGTIACWDLNEKRKVISYKSHVSAVRCISVSPNGLFMISGGRDQVINIWETAKAKCIKTIPAMESVESLVFLDDDTFVSAGEKGVLRKWNLKQGACVQKSAELATADHGFSSVSLSDGHLVATTTDLHILSINAESFELEAVMPGNLGEVTDVSFLEDGSLAVATNGPNLKVFSALPSLSCQSLSGHTAAILSVASHGNWIVTGSRDNTVRLWTREGETFRCITSLSGHTDSIGAVAIIGVNNSSLPLFASASADMTIKLWEVSLNTQKEYHVFSRWTIKAHERDINSLAFTPNGKLLISGSQDRTAKIWKLEDGSLHGTLKGHKRGVWAVRCSPTEQVIATASSDQTVKLWSASTFECLKTFEGHTNSVLRIAFLRDGSELLSTGSDGLVKIWTVRTNECSRTFDEHLDRIWTLSMHQDIMATGDASGCIKIWRDCTQEEIQESQAKSENQLIMEQNLSNMLVRKDFKNAILISLELEQPFRLFNLLNEFTKGCSVQESTLKLSGLFESIPEEKLDRILLYIRDWNTSFKRASLAQIVLCVLLRMRDSVALPSLLECCKALLPYSERHFEHVQDLQASVYLVDFVLSHMDSMQA